jgi:SAM-dependent methyltransferase
MASEHSSGPAEAGPSGTEPYRYRREAESFGADAERYDRTRPAYPAALVRRLIAASPGRDVLDVGCGTGTEARQFQAAGCDVLGVDPDQRMASFARRTGVPVEVARFEAWDPAGRTFDMVIAGTAWHWVDPAAGAVKAARVLRPGGLIAPFTTVRQAPAALTEALAAAYQRVVPDSPVSLDPARPLLDAYRSVFAKIAGGIRAAGAFSEPEQWQFDWEYTYTRPGWLDWLSTQPLLSPLPNDKRAGVLTAVGIAIDATGGTFTVPHTTVAITATRTSDHCPGR